MIFIFFKKYYRGLFFLFLLGLIFIRAREILLFPRFWAEEATLYFKGIYESSWLEGLLFIPHHVAEYISLAVNIPLVIAVNFFPLHYTAYITTYFSLFILLIPYLLILYGHSYLWESSRQRIIVCLLLLLTPTAVEPEVLLNTINLQVHCGLISVCILFENLHHFDTQTTKKWLYRLLLVFCGLSGVYTTFLSFAFLIKAYYEKSTEAWRHFGIVCSTSLIQTLLFIRIYQQGIGGDEKLVYFDMLKAPLYIFNHHIMTPLLGFWVRLELNTPDLLKEDYFSRLSLLILSIGVIAIVGLFFYRILKNKTSPYLLLLVISFLSISILTSIGSMGGAPGARYAVIPGFLFTLILFYSVQWQRPFNYYTIAISVVLSISLLIGSFYFFETRKYWLNRQYLPIWSVEVAQWQKNADYFLVSWPYPWVDDSWKFYLSKRSLVTSLNSTMSQQPPIYLNTEAGKTVNYSINIDGLPADFYWDFDVKVIGHQQNYQAQILFIGQKGEVYGRYDVKQALQQQPSYHLRLNSIDRRTWPHVKILPHYQTVEKIVFQLTATTKTQLVFDNFSIHTHKLSVF